MHFCSSSYKAYIYIYRTKDALFLPRDGQTISSTHCTYPRRDGEAEWAWVAWINTGIAGPPIIPLLTGLDVAQFCWCGQTVTTTPNQPRWLFIVETFYNVKYVLCNTFGGGKELGHFWHFYNTFTTLRCWWRTLALQLPHSLQEKPLVYFRYSSLRLAVKIGREILCTVNV